jgi:serine/threonine protein phosphatase PrpC
MFISANTHPGKMRKANQDAFVVRPLWSAAKTLAVVIDGVGGYAGGEKAAAIAKDCIEQYMGTPSGDILTMLREALVFANNTIVEERKKDPSTSEMCCVLTAVATDANAGLVYYVHVGDTRLYRYRDGNLQKLTKDHSVVGIREDAGEMTEEEAMAHPQRNQILREAGTATHRLDDTDFMDYGSEPLLRGDLLLLCSDGLTDMVTARQISCILSGNQSLVGKVNSLLDSANAKGGHDNITVVLLQQPYTSALLKALIKDTQNSTHAHLNL